ncbi:hypothetical protein QT231_13625 [Halomonas sp. SpR1]|uniref:hypothetical protein n=1 Tax=Halomonas sp. SpR1 TaxID=3050462 RepID=UPI0027E45D01|nr:hypothetical protein [Halomonas sp. SpR1]MDQ7733747.1 hypothetical protein [Halomonas sp. SpR1]
MNKSQLEHALIALLIQLVLWPYLGMWVAGAIAVTLLLGREIAQNEYRLASRRGWKWGEPLPVKWHEGVWRAWTSDSVYDVLVPLALCVLAALALSLL